MPRTIRIQIRWLRGPAAGQERTESISFPHQGRILAGRDPSANLHIDHPTVSLFHFALTVDQGMFWVEDLGSQNGTQMHGVRLQPHTKTPCAPGDLLVVGPFLIAILDPTLDRPLGAAGSTQSLALEAVLKLLSDSDSETAFLTLASGPRTGTKIPIPMGRPLLIGRDPGSHLVVPDPNVSHKHARVYADAEGVWLEDLHSRHGTFVDGRRIFGLWKLSMDQVIRLGDTTLDFHDPAEQFLADLQAAANDLVESPGPRPQPEGPKPLEKKSDQDQSRQGSPLPQGSDRQTHPNPDPAALDAQQANDDLAEADVPGAAPLRDDSDNEHSSSSEHASDKESAEPDSSVWWIAGLVGGIGVVLAAAGLFVWLLTR